MGDKPVLTSATAEPHVGMLVSCTGVFYRLTHVHEGTWWGTRGGSRPGEWSHSTFTCPVPKPFLFVVDDLVTSLILLHRELESKLNVQKLLLDALVVLMTKEES